MSAYRAAAPSQRTRWFFFKMSRSIRASARSRLSRDTSASSSVTGRRLSPSVVSWPCRARPTQRSSVLPDILRRLATSGIVTYCSKTSRTACSRNSFVYCCRGKCSIPHLQTSDHRLKASTFSSLAQWVAGGERCQDLQPLRADAALATFVGYELPAATTMRDFLEACHVEEPPLWRGREVCHPGGVGPAGGAGGCKPVRPGRRAAIGPATHCHAGCGCDDLSRMRKKTASGVLASLRGSTYGPEYDSPLHSLRPCWTAFLRILYGCSASSRPPISETATEVNMSFTAAC